MPGRRIRLAWPTARPAATVAGMRPTGMPRGSTATAPGPAAARAPASRDGSARAAGGAAGRGVVVPPVPDAIASAFVADVDELTEALRVPAGEPAGALVLLHGRGTSEQDVRAADRRLRPARAARRRVPARAAGAAADRAPLVRDAGGRAPRRRDVPGHLRAPAVLARGPGRAHRGADRAHRARRLLPGRGDGVGAGARPRPPAAGRDPRHERRAARRAGLRAPARRPRRAAGRDHARDAGPARRRRARPGRARPRRAGGADVVYRETEVPHIIDPRVVPGLVTWLDARF